MGVGLSQGRFDRFWITLCTYGARAGGLRVLRAVRPVSGGGLPPLFLKFAQWHVDGLEEILDRAVFGRDDVGPCLRDGGREGLPETDGFVRGGPSRRFREGPSPERGP
ncbi:hypothetical protein KBZ94_23130 [Streptomyces sp. RM72]|uniref:hypothetical protein n=1 Tax=Streptomyces sp. RM72 TaxID=1115510 RepID=UPI001B3612A5|nr:hypothetical protein [Streptomyces sp. RM72]MBQ0887789.1 hypothetical protein [Streptomyces sp. RM72]